MENYVNDIITGGFIVGIISCSLPWLIGYGLHGIISTFKYIVNVK